MKAFACRLTLAFSLILVAACTTTGGARKTEAEEKTALMEAQVPLPETINKLALAERKVYDNPAAGVQYRYAGDLVYYVDVFVYPLNETQTSLLITSKEENLVTNELGRFHAEMNYAREQGWYQAAEPVDEKLQSWTIEYASDGESRKTSFIVAQSEYRLRKNDVDLASYLALSEFNGYFVKVRLTHPAYPGLRGEAESFARMLYHSLYGTQTLMPIISIGKSDKKIDVTCMPGESMLECMSRGLRRMAPEKTEETAGEDAAS